MKTSLVQAESVADRHGYSLWVRNQPYRLPRFHQSPRRPIATRIVADELMFIAPRYPTIPMVAKRASVGSAIESLLVGLLFVAIIAAVMVVW